MRLLSKLKFSICLFLCLSVYLFLSFFLPFLSFFLLPSFLPSFCPFFFSFFRKTFIIKVFWYRMIWLIFKLLTRNCRVLIIINVQTKEVKTIYLIEFFENVSFDVFISRRFQVEVPFDPARSIPDFRVTHFRAVLAAHPFKHWVQMLNFQFF